MDVRIVTTDPAHVAAAAADALLVVVCGASLPDGLDPALAAALGAAVERGDLAFEAGKTAFLAAAPGVAAPRLAVVVARDGAARSVARGAAAGIAMLKPLGVRHLAVVLAGAPLDAAHAEALCLAAADAVYVYRATKPSAPAAPKLAALSLLAGDAAQAAAAARGVALGQAIAEGVAFARDLANRPGNHCTPSRLADEAKALAKASKAIDVEVLDRKAIEAAGMGSFLAVARGSDEPPRFIVLRYRGAVGAGTKAAKGRTSKAGRKAAMAGAGPLVLIGKGITFDSGGISLKPGAEMDEMKFDMGGAASVLGAFRALARLAPALDVVGLIPATENMPSGRALKPGDVITSLSGQTIEVLNTDAEGRLILCDALTYAERFNPAAVVDVATLTGACVIALGHIRSALYSPDETLAAELSAAGDAALDPCWRMPLDDDYDEGLKSNFADVANIAGRAGGSVTAAMFLKRFTGKLPAWAHLDIAGTAWKSGGAAKGATGRPVGLLVHWIAARAATAGASAAP